MPSAQPPRETRMMESPGSTECRNASLKKAHEAEGKVPAV
jgi:hypothetical protein